MPTVKTQLSNAFQEVQRTNSYTLDSVPARDLNEYQEAFQDLFNAAVGTDAFYPCLKLDAEFHQESLIYRYQSKLYCGGVALILSWVIYRATQPYFTQKWEECVAAANDLSTSKWTYDPIEQPSTNGLLAFGSSLLENPLEKVLVSEGVPTKPMQIWKAKGYQTSYFLRDLTIVSLTALGWQKPELKKPRFCSISLEKNFLKNTQKNGKYFCPLSKEELSENPPPIRIGDYLLSLGACCKCWFESGVLVDPMKRENPLSEEEKTRLDSTLQDVFEIDLEAFSNLMTQTWTPKEASKRCTQGELGRFPEDLFEWGLLDAERTRLDSDIPSTMMGLDHAEAYRELIKGLNLPFEDCGIPMQDQDIALETLPTILNLWGASLDGYNIRVKDLVESPPSFPTFAKVLTSGYYIFRTHKGVSKDPPEGVDGLDNDIAELIELFNLLLKLEVTTSKKPEEGEISLVELLGLPQRLENLLGKMRKFDSDLILSTEKKGNMANNPDHKPKDLPFNLFKIQIGKIEELITRFKALKLSTNIKILLLWEALYCHISPQVEHTRCTVDVANAQYEYNPAAFVVFEIINQHFGFLDDEKSEELHTACLKVKALEVFKVEKEKHLEKYFSEKSGALERFNLSERLSRLCYRKESSEAHHP